MISRSNFVMCWGPESRTFFEEARPLKNTYGAGTIKLIKRDLNSVKTPKNGSRKLGSRAFLEGFGAEISKKKYTSTLVMISF